MRVSVCEDFANFIGSFIDYILEYQGLKRKFVRPPGKVSNFPPHRGGRNGGVDAGDKVISAPFLGGTEEAPDFGAQFLERDEILRVIS